MGLKSEAGMTAPDREAEPASRKAELDRRGAPIVKPRYRSRRPLVALAVLAAGFAGFWYWSARVRALAVPVAAIRTNVAEQVFGLGTVGAHVESEVGFKVSGVLVAVDADEGDHVRTGQVLARLDARDIEAQLAVAKAGVAQAEANVTKAEADVASAKATLVNATAISTRDSRLIKSGLVSTEQAETDQAAVRIAAANLVSARSGVVLAKAQLRSAKATRMVSEATLADYTLYAPYDAWVVSRNLNLGSAVNPGQSVFTLIEPKGIWVLGYVDERLAGRLAVGQPAEIILRSEPGKRYSGHIARIEIQSDAVNEERLVDVAFDHIPASIHLAEQAEVLITTGILSKAVVMPPTMISDLKDGKGTVWITENGRLARRRVSLGPELLNGQYPILAGIPAGVQVIAAPVSGLRVGRAAIARKATRP